MDVYSWSVSLVWTVIGALMGAGLDKLFDARMSLIAGVAAGLSSLVLAFVGPPGLENHVELLSGYFAGTLALLLWKQVQGSLANQAVLSFFVFHCLSVLILAVYWFIVVVRIFRYHYGLGPAYSVVDPLIVFGLLALYVLVFFRILFLGPLAPSSFLGILCLVVLGVAEQVPMYFILFQLIGWLFVDDFNVSWSLALAAFPILVVVVLAKMLGQFAMLGALSTRSANSSRKGGERT